MCVSHLAQLATPSIEEIGMQASAKLKQVQVNKGRAERCTDTERKTRSTTKRVTSEFEFTERHPNPSSPQLLK